MNHRLLFLTPALAAALTACAHGATEAPPATATAPTTSAPPAEPAPPSPAAALPPLVEEAIVRVQGLLADPNEAAIKATFSPTFLAAVPADKVKVLFTQVKTEVGACKEHRAEQVKNDTSALVRLQCEHGAIHATIVVSPAPPHLVDGLMLKPAS